MFSKNIKTYEKFIGGYTELMIDTFYNNEASREGSQSP